jgi:hypothetical protein
MIPGGMRIDEHATAGRRKAPGQRAAPRTCRLESESPWDRAVCGRGISPDPMKDQG